MEQLYKETLERLTAELKNSCRRLRQTATGSGITRRQDLRKYKPSSTVWMS